MNPKIYTLNAMSSGLDTLNFLTDKIEIAGIIGLEATNTAKISNYSDTGIWAMEHSLPYITISDYSIKNEEEISKLKSLDIDILIVTGWQRLIPKWLIEQCKVGVIGLHGSPWGITKGRGRSPQNWSIIMGEKQFSLSAFLIQPGTDDGPVLSTTLYELNEWDDIVSSYVKVSWLYAQMIINVIPQILQGWKGYPQTGEPEYLPQRVFEDGRIDWKWSNIDISRQIRALTRPYPGAWSIINDNIVCIWQAQPVEELVGFQQYSPGEIIAAYPNIPAFLVKTGKGALLVRSWEVRNKEQTQSNSLLFDNSMKYFDNAFSGYDQLKEIFLKHQQKYPDKPLSKELLMWCDNFLKK